MPVGFQVASELKVPLDVFLVRKLGVPGHEELAMGAIASGGVRVLNEEVIRRIPISVEAIERVTAREQLELRRRELARERDDLEHRLEEEKERTRRLQAKLRELGVEP